MLIMLDHEGRLTPSLPMAEPQQASDFAWRSTPTAKSPWANGAGVGRVHGDQPPQTWRRSAAPCWRLWCCCGAAVVLLWPVQAMRQR
jgi:hypothetical protein